MKFPYYDIETEFGNFYFKNLIIIPIGNVDKYNDVSEFWGNKSWDIQYDANIESLDICYDECEIINENDEIVKLSEEEIIKVIKFEFLNNKNHVRRLTEELIQNER